MQAWLLHIIYGTFMGDASQYNNVKMMLRTVVDVRVTLLATFCSWCRAETVTM